MDPISQSHCQARSGTIRARRPGQSSVRRFGCLAALLGFWGGALGVLAGYGLSRLANLYAGSALSSQHLSAQTIISIPWWLGLAVIIATTIIGVLAGLYPAIRASRLNPVEALRYE